METFRIWDGVVKERDGRVEEGVSMFVGVPALRGPVKEAKTDLAEKKEPVTYEPSPSG